MNEEDIRLYGTLYRDFCFSREMPREEAEGYFPYGCVSSDKGKYCVSCVPTPTYDRIACFSPGFRVFETAAHLLIDRKFLLGDYTVMRFVDSVREAELLAESLGKTPVAVDGLIFQN